MILFESNLKVYGSHPARVLLVHGGPGAIGHLAPLANVLSKHYGTIEAYQSRNTINELLEELQEIIIKQAIEPLILVGHSWGAWLSLLYANYNQQHVSKLILLAAPPFQEEFAPSILETRLERLKNDESNYLLRLMQQFEDIDSKRKNEIFLEIASILRKADAYAVEEKSPPEININYTQYNAIWEEAVQMRKSGELLRQASQIVCPVLAIHGDHDPHPWEGVDAPLDGRIRDFRFILLEKCGHEPWSEKYAKEDFFRIMEDELSLITK